MVENNQQLSYKEVLILAMGCYDLALENYSIESYPEILPNQNLLKKAAKLLRTVEKQGYNDHLWCGLLGDVLYYVRDCSDAAFALMERSLAICPTFPKELLNACYESI